MSHPSGTSQGNDILVTEDELQQVERSYRQQMRLSFSYGAVFFAVTLLIPFLSGTVELWYGRPVLAGLSLNFWTSILFFHVFYWLLAFLFVRKANRLDGKLKAGEE